MKKGRIVNILILIFLGLLIFTPIGFHTKVFINRIISFNPEVLDEAERRELSSFDWQLYSRSGNVVDLSDSQGEVIFVNIWATWCPPCVAEMPDLENLYKDYKEEVVFLFVAHDQQDKVDQFLQKHQYDIPVYFDMEQPPAELQSNSLPTTYILSRDGSIAVAEKGSANWNGKKTRALLDNLIGKQ